MPGQDIEALRAIAPYLLGFVAALVASAGLLWGLRPRGRDLLQDTAPWVLLLRVLAIFTFMVSIFYLLGAFGFLFVVVLALTYSYSQKTHLWMILSSALRHNRPLMPVLSAFLRDSKTLIPSPRIMRALAAGETLHDVIRKYGWGLWQHRMFLRIAALTGSWREAFETMRRGSLALREGEELFYGRGAILSLMGLILAAEMTYISFNVIPHMAAIAREFSMPAHSAVIKFVSTFNPTLPAFGYLAVFGLLFAVLGPVLFLAGGEGYPRDFLPFLSCSSAARWPILQALAHGVRAGKPYPEILQGILEAMVVRLYFFRLSSRVGVTYRLRKALRQIVAGEDAAEALRRSGFITWTDGEVLRAAETLGNLADAYQTLADLYRDRYAARLRSWAIYGYVFILAIAAAIAVGLYLIILNFLVTLAVTLA